MAEHSLELSQHEYTAHLSALSSRCAELEAVAAQKQLAAESLAAASEIGARQAEAMQQQSAHLQQQQRQTDTELRKARQEAQEATMALLEQQAANKEAAAAIREQVIEHDMISPMLDSNNHIIYNIFIIFHIQIRSDQIRSVSVHLVSSTCIYESHHPNSLQKQARALERCRSELKTAMSEQAALRRLNDSTETALRLQHSSQESQLRLLQQRQAALEAIEAANSPAFDELARVQGVLQKLLSQEGHALHGQIHDVRSLTTMLVAVREKMEQVRQCLTVAVTVHTPQPPAKTNNSNYIHYIQLYSVYTIYLIFSSVLYSPYCPDSITECERTSGIGKSVGGGERGKGGCR